MSGRQPLELPSHEVLSQLARDDPPAYEAWRRETIESFIDGAPENIRPRLRGIQFRVDSMRRLSRSPLGAAVKVQTLMWESFLRLNDGWQEFLRLEKERANAPGSTPATKYVPTGSARILAFRPRQPRDQD